MMSSVNIYVVVNFLSQVIFFFFLGGGGMINTGDKTINYNRHIKI